MPLNKSTGNMYAWLDSTWNPVKGQCEHACVYCYMNQKRLNPLRLDRSEMKTNLAEGQFIFVGSSTDMFAESVPKSWICAVLEWCSMFNRTFLFQSKNPKRMYDFESEGAFPKHHIIATTLETNRNIPDISKAPPIAERVYWMNRIRGLDAETTITIEPIMQFDLAQLVESVKYCYPKWVSIGADSKGHKLPEPQAEDVRLLISELEKFTKVEQKANLKRIVR